MLPQFFRSFLCFLRIYLSVDIPPDSLSRFISQNASPLIHQPLSHIRLCVFLVYFKYRFTYRAA